MSIEAKNEALRTALSGEWLPDGVAQEVRAALTQDNDDGVVGELRLCNAAMAETLLSCARVFAGYAEHHASKKTQDGEQKAEKNRVLAANVERVVAQYGGSQRY